MTALRDDTLPPTARQAQERPEDSPQHRTAPGGDDLAAERPRHVRRRFPSFDARQGTWQGAY
ncbi:MAG TPA: hypothetical protein VHB98_23080 [Chloroflexota bacterium]|nr:hypothetical protein [Chloroflexota bacterium]